MSTLARIPSDRPAAVADAFTTVAMFLAAIAAIAGLLVPNLYRNSEGWVRQARGADFVTLSAVVPMLAARLWRGRQGTGRLLIVGGGSVWT